MAMRRVVVTPTFAAGLGVVVAAVLAYPMQTVLNYAAPNGTRCNSSCGVSAQDGGRTAGVGGRLSTSSPASAAPGAGGAAGSGRSAPGRGHTKPALAATPPELRFRASARWQSGFDATILITFPPGSAHSRWRLRIGYPSDRILKVWAGGYLEHGVHTAMVTSADWPGQASYHRTMTFSIGVTGRPGAPGRCSFDGRACHISTRRGAQRLGTQQWGNQGR